jgi:hypothetical protein
METLLIVTGIAAVFFFFYFKKKKLPSANPLVKAEAGVHRPDHKPPKESAIRFSVYRPDPDEVREVKAGDLVRFWRGTEYPDFIYIFREGLPLYGMGRRGMVPDSHFSVMCPYVENNGSFIASVYEKNGNSCSIEVRKKTADELEQEEKERLDGIKI